MVSGTFEQFTELLKRIELSDVEIGNVTMPERITDRDAELAAELSLEIPMVHAVADDSTVTVQPTELSMDEDRLQVGLSVSLPVTDGPTGGQTRQPTIARQLQDAHRIPAYKDPKALAAVYHEYDTFPEMTEALGVDVTSETVRRYMVEYEIHDPTDHSPQQLRAAALGDDVPETASTEGSAHITSTTVERSTEPSNVSPYADESVAELLERADGDDSIAADGLGIPRELTLAEFAEIINDASSITEVSNRLDLGVSTVRQLLEKLNLVHIVTNQLAAGQITVSETALYRRIDPDALD
ncbi:hypothetical protein [Halocatena halophila]|uniref:hypothetical protein n=1 Tax=Halocatena halophila TaxID=2814576 RepID=UPI002ED515A2